MNLFATMRSLSEAHMEYICAPAISGMPRIKLSLDYIYFLNAHTKIGQFME